MSSGSSDKKQNFPIKVNIKYTNEIKKELLLQENTKTVPELKELIEKELSIPSQEQRLIFSGKLLKDVDEISKYSLYDGCTLHLVRHAGAPKPTAEPPSQTSAASEPPSTASPNQSYASNAQMPFAGTFPGMGGMGGMPNNPEFARQLMQNPDVMRGVAQMISENPALFQTMIQNDPQLQSLPQETRNILANPDVLRLMLNPELMASMRTAFGQNIPQGASQQSQPFNPWSMAGNANYAQSPQQTPQSQQEPPAVRFAAQLEQLKQMGFYDESTNIQALTVTNGNINAAVDWLLSRPL